MPNNTAIRRAAGTDRQPWVACPGGAVRMAPRQVSAICKDGCSLTLQMKGMAMSEDSTPGSAPSETYHDPTSIASVIDHTLLKPEAPARTS